MIEQEITDKILAQLSGLTIQEATDLLRYLAIKIEKKALEI